MNITDQTIFLTGAAGGLGREFVKGALQAGCKKIYAADLRNLPTQARVEPLLLDITNEKAVAKAAALAQDVTLLINNAGVNLRSALIGSPTLEPARCEMEVNYFGNLHMCRAFAPILAKNGGGAIVVILSILAKVTLPNLGTYCASKAALLRLCEGVRAELAPQKTSVMAVMPWAVDTVMSGNFQGEKTSPQDVVSGVFKSLEQSSDEVYFHEFTHSINRRLREDPETLVKELGAQFRNAK